MKNFKNLAVVFSAALFLLIFAAWGILKPDEAQSTSERRPLAAFPEISGESVLSGKFMTAFEKYTLDQFPLRENFRTLKAAVVFYAFGQKDNNGIYIADGHASKLEYPADSGSTDYAAERFRFVYDKYISGKKMNVYLSVIPDKNLFSAAENGFPSMDYHSFINEISSKMSYAKYIDITHLLQLDDYYKTDAHWKQEEITDVAAYLADKMGADLSGKYDKVKIDAPFYGVYYGQAALPMKADELYYLTSSTISGLKVFDFETQEYSPVYDLEKVSGNDAYEMFLSGSKSLLTIENPAFGGSRELIVFRDSFGSSIAPLLAEGYSKITLVDIRYISPGMLGSFIDFSAQDVLFLYSTSVLNNSITIK